MVNMKKISLPIVIEKDKNGYFAYCPSLQGCYTQGDTYEEVLRNIEDAVKLHLEDRIKSHEPIPRPEKLSLTSIEVSV
jgi:predicted RNase H-like HicB family nuclease